MKHFVIEVTYLVPLEKIDENLVDHRAFLQKGYDKGWLLMSGSQNPRTGGIIIARGPSLEEISEFFKDDPFQKRSLAKYRIIEFTPVKRNTFIEPWIEGKI